MNKEARDQILQPVTSVEKPLLAEEQTDVNENISRISMPARLTVLCVFLSFLATACTDSGIKAQISSLHEQVEELQRKRVTGEVTNALSERITALEKIIKEIQQSKKPTLEEKSNIKDIADESRRTQEIKIALNSAFGSELKDSDIPMKNLIRQMFEQYFSINAVKNRKDENFNEDHQKTKAIHTYGYWRHDVGFDTEMKKNLFKYLEANPENLDKIVKHLIATFKKLPENMRADIIDTFLELFGIFTKAKELYPKYKSILATHDKWEEANEKEEQMTDKDTKGVSADKLHGLHIEYQQLGENDKLLQSFIRFIHELDQKNLLQKGKALFKNIRVLLAGK